MSNTTISRNPFTPADAPSCADVIERVKAAKDLTRRQRQDQASAVKTLCEKVLEQDPVEVPAQQPEPLIHPHLAELYRLKIRNLNEALFDDDTKAEAFEVIRSLVDEITLTPGNGDLRIDLKGELAGILSLCSGNKKPAGFKTSNPEQIKAVAGARNQRYLPLSEVWL